MKKRIFAILLIMCAIIYLVGCSKAEAWNEKDFSFYEKEGNEKISLTTNKPVIMLSDNPELFTARGVGLGDDAVTALEKYDLPIEYAIYVNALGVFFDKNAEQICNENGSYKKVTSIAEVIKVFSEEGWTLYIPLNFDNKFNVLSTYEFIDSGESEKYPDNAEWFINFVIENGKIRDVFVS